MNFWIAYAIAFVAWWMLYAFVSDRMTDWGIGWINAMMIAALVFLARPYPSYRNWTYGLGLLWNVFNGLVMGVAGLIAIVALWCAGV